MTSMQEKALALRAEAVKERDRGDYQSSLKKLLMSLSFESSPLTYLEKSKTLLKIWQTEKYGEAFGIIEGLCFVRKLDKNFSFESEVDIMLDDLKATVEERCKEVSEEDTASFLSQFNFEDEPSYATEKIPQDTLSIAIFDAKKTADLCKKELKHPELDKGFRRLEALLDELLRSLI